MTDNTCQRCGACCRLIALSTIHMPPAYKRYLLNHGLKEDLGFILIPHECQHLIEVPVPGDYNAIPAMEFACDIHESPDRPQVCRKFHGQKRIGPWNVYVPPGCAFNKKE